MSALRSTCFLITWSHFGVIFFLSFGWDLNSFKATTTEVLESIKPSSGRWQAPKQLQVIAKLRLRGTAIQQLSRTAPPQKGCPCSLSKDGWLMVLYALCPGFHSLTCDSVLPCYLHFWLHFSHLWPMILVSSLSSKSSFFFFFLLLTYCWYVFNALPSALGHDSD